MLLKLPHGAEEFLEGQGVVEFSDLLEFVDADDDANVFSGRDVFRQLKNFFGFGSDVFDFDLSFAAFCTRNRPR